MTMGPKLLKKKNYGAKNAIQFDGNLGDKCGTKHIQAFSDYFLSDYILTGPKVQFDRG